MNDLIQSVFGAEPRRVPVGESGEMPRRPTPADVIRAMAICGNCGAPVQLLPDPIVFEAPRERLPPPLVSDGKRMMIAALYFRDPFHTRLPFENYCDSACSLARYAVPLSPTG